MAQWIGGIKSFVFGTSGDGVTQTFVMILCSFGVALLALAFLCVLIWLIRVRPRTPMLDDDWNSDCEKTTTAEITGAKIRYRNIRDFLWRTTRDRDEAWQDSLEVDADEIKDVWFVVDHFHSFQGLAHTFLTFEFNDGTCLSFSFEARRRKGQKYHKHPIHQIYLRFYLPKINLKHLSSSFLQNLVRKDFVLDVLC